MRSKKIVKTYLTSFRSAEQVTGKNLSTKTDFELSDGHLDIVKQVLSDLGGLLP